jgi:hypothetical protein
LKLDYAEKTGKFLVKVPRDYDLINKLMKVDGLNFWTGSPKDEAILWTDNSYAALTYAEHATDTAKALLTPYLPELQASYAKTGTGSYAVPDGLDLYPYQKTGVDYCLRRNNALIGDEPGLGKTPQAIVIANEMKAKSILVVTPANIRLQWQERIHQWCTMKHRFLTYPILKSSDGVHPTAEWVIISYDLMRSPEIQAAIAQRTWDLIILDEAHKLKNPETKQTQALFGDDAVCQNAGYVLALTGTPLPNRPSECLGGSVKVLTDRGWKPIVDVKLTDKLWDGEEWVTHEGVIFQGIKKTLSIAGITATEDHLFLAKSSWVSAKEARRNTDILSQMLARGSQNLPLRGTLGVSVERFKNLSFLAIAEAESFLQRFRGFYAGALPSAGVAAQCKEGQAEKYLPEHMTCFAKTKKSETNFETHFREPYNAAQTPITGLTSHTEAEELLSINRGLETGYQRCGTCYPLRDTMTLLKNWIASTTIRGMNPAILGLSTEKRTVKIEERLESSKKRSQNLKPVYDIVNAGPRHRFTILSDRGPIISHNCFTLAKNLCWDAIDYMNEDEFTSRFNPQMLKEYGRGKKAKIEKKGRLSELRNRLRVNFMVRRKKRDVLEQLPDIRYDIIHVQENGQVRKALDYEAENLRDIDPTDLSGSNAEILGHISTARKMMGVAIAPLAADYVTEILEGGEHKVFVPAWHIDVLNILEQRLAKFNPVRVDGSTSARRKEAAVLKFQDDDQCRVFIGNIQSIGVGVDGLQNVCSRGICPEPSWTPADNDQAVGRLERIGQKHGILFEFVTAKGSLIELILQRSLEKLQDIHSSLDG